MLVSENQLFGSPKNVYLVTMGQTYQYDLVPIGHVNQ